MTSLKTASVCIAFKPVGTDRLGDYGSSPLAAIDPLKSALLGATPNWMESARNESRLSRQTRRQWDSLALLLCSVIALNSCWPASAAEYVDLKLVLATDVSGSINNDELWLERTGTAAAFRDPAVIRSIQGGALGRVAVSILDFSSPGFGKTVVGWRVIRDAATAAAFARAILALPRTPGDRTSVSNALELGAQAIQSSTNEIVATRKVIDVTGDGPNNIGKPLLEIRERTLAQGIVVNGLSVMDENANGYFRNLDKYYQACVAGGRGAFVMVVHSYRDFALAMRRKLILEISQNQQDGNKQAKGERERGALVRRIVARQINPAEAPVLLRPGRNDFSRRCDIRD